jgi:hypothetical protein
LHEACVSDGEAGICADAIPETLEDLKGLYDLFPILIEPMNGHPFLPGIPANKSTPRSTIEQLYGEIIKAGLRQDMRQDMRQPLFAGVFS